MDFKSFLPDKSISLFVKNILVFEETEKNQKTILPFFADGYPGLLFHETKNGLVVNPHKKNMPLLFLYGQTIKPIELVIQGNYKLIIFQLYPFVLKRFFGVEPKDINDGCFDLTQFESSRGTKTAEDLICAKKLEERITLLTELLYHSFQSKKDQLDFKIREVIQLILENKGQLGVRKIYTHLNLNERTIERRFIKEVGISPKQFSSIIQFQNSLEQLSIKDYTKLSDVVYENGFADQSHFIRVFKAFTGKTPKKFTV